MVPCYEGTKSFAPSPQKMDFWPKNGQIWPAQNWHFGHFGPNICPFGSDDAMQNGKFWPNNGLFGTILDQKNNANEVPTWFSDMLLPPKMIRMFGPKTVIYAPKYALLGKLNPCLLIWCPVGWLVVVARGLL